MEQLSEHPKEDSFEIFGKKFQADQEGYVSFNEISNKLLLKEHQYGSWFIKKFSEKDDSPELGKDLRFKGNDSYYGMKIYKDDIEEFIKRVYTFRKENDEFFKHSLINNPDSEIAKIAKNL